MSEKLDRGRQQSVVVPEYFAKILKNKDRIIRVQARRIELLEEEVHRLRVARESMSSQLAILSCKLKVLSAARNDEAPHGNDSRFSGPKSHQLKHETMERNTKQIESNKNSSVDAHPSNASNNLISFYGNRNVELLERKYGDYAQANKAALKIQQMYRQYSLNRNFKKLRLEAGDSSRRSRRFTKLAAEHNQKSASEAVRRADQVTLSSKNAAGQKFQCRSVENGESRNRSSRSSDSDLDRTLAKVEQLPQQEGPPFTPSDRKFKNSVDRFFENKDVKNFHNRSENFSPLSVPSAVDLPSFNFESLLDRRSKNPAIFCENNKKDGNWSSSSSSPKVSTPVDSIPIMTYVDRDCIKNSSEIGEVAITFKSNEMNCDPDLPQRTSAALVSSDYDSVFLSMPPFGVYSHSQTDGNCLRHHHGPDKPSSGNSSGKSLGSSTEGHYSREHKHSVGLTHTCNHVGSHSFGTRPHVVQGDSETSEPISRMPEIGYDITSNDANFDAAEVEIAMCNSSHELQASSSSSDVASLGSNNDIKIPSGGFNSEISSEDYELYVQRNNTHFNDKQRKRKYRIGLNLFNRKPEKGIRFLIENRFLDNKPCDIAHFLLTRKGLSKQMIGEYLGNLLQQFNMDVLECFVNEIDFTGIPIDKALRKFQSHFRLPGEAQKIEKLMEAFASSYITSNPDVVRKFAHPDTVFLIAYAIIMLNTDLHNNNIKPDRKMKLQDFIRNLRGIDGGEDVDPELLTSIFDRIAAYPLKSANDHVVQVMKVEKMILGKKPLLPEPHRRLICYCRLYEVKDPSKREKSNSHQREVFLFNDLLLITKLNNKKKDSLLYNYRESFHLFGLMIVLFELPHCKHGVQLTSNFDNRILITLCASNEADRIKFVEDLNEAIIEVNEMEAMRVQEEFAASTRNFTDVLRRTKDSGALDQNPNHLGINIVENRLSAPDCSALNKSSPNSSNGDVIDGKHRLSSGSLDSGLPSVNSASSNSSFQVQDRSVQKPRDAPKFNIFTRKPRTTKSSSAEPV